MEFWDQDDCASYASRAYRMMLAALFSAAFVAALPVQVESAACPSGHEVEQPLDSMLPSVPEKVRPDVAHVLRRGNQLQVVLVGTDAAVIAERWIDDTGACSELAELIAVVIASWESDVHPEFARPHGEPVAAALAEKPAAPPAPAPQTAPFYEVAAGSSLSWSGSPGLGGILSMGLVPRGAGPGLRLRTPVGLLSTDLGIRINGPTRGEFKTNPSQMRLPFSEANQVRTRKPMTTIATATNKP